MDRRRFIGTGLAATGGAVVGTNPLGRAALAAPTRVISGDQKMNNLTVAPDEVVAFDPDKSTTLTVSGDVHVHGVLRMRPSRPKVVHRLVLTGEGAGVHVMQRGKLDIKGGRKRGWTRARSSIGRGDRQIKVYSLKGWRVGDRVVITPTGAPQDEDHLNHYDSGRITAIHRKTKTITLENGCDHAHPMVTVGGFRGESKKRRYGAEVMNLSRNVIVESTSNSKAHIHISANREQYVAYAELRELGTRDELGRYPLHFHEAGGGSRRSKVIGVAVHDCYNHAFVPHTSHGITFRDCVAHNIIDDPYWWDPGADTEDVLFDRCIASKVRPSDDRGFRLAGFWIGAARERLGNVARGCVSVGIGGLADASGFHWPENNEGVWVFENCLAHNNARHGIFTWQNTNKPHTIKNFIAYHNGGSGIDHGAYLNPYIYEDCLLFGNRRAGITLHSLSHESPAKFIGLVIDSDGKSDYCFETLKHTLEAPSETIVRNSSFKGSRKACVGFAPDESGTQAESFRFEDNSFSGNEFYLDSVHEGSVIKVSGGGLGNLTVRHRSKPGNYRADWNASVS